MEHIPNDAHWYYIKNTKQGVTSLLQMFWSFHDFRVEDVHYYPGRNTVDVTLEYDTHNFKVCLRFIGVHNFNLVHQDPADYEADWLSGASFFVDESGSIVWVCEDFFREAASLPDGVMWVKSDMLHYAMMDNEHHTVEIPDDIRHQESYVLDHETMKYTEEKRALHFSPQHLPAKSCHSCAVFAGKVFDGLYEYCRTCKDYGNWRVDGHAEGQRS